MACPTWGLLSSRVSGLSHLKLEARRNPVGGSGGVRLYGFAGTALRANHELKRMHLVTLATPHGHVAQRSVTTAGQQAIRARSNCPHRNRSFI